MSRVQSVVVAAGITRLASLLDWQDLCPHFSVTLTVTKHDSVSAIPTRGNGCKLATAVCRR